jgi:hypothetical protein
MSGLSVSARSKELASSWQPPTGGVRLEAMNPDQPTEVCCYRTRSPKPLSKAQGLSFPPDAPPKGQLVGSHNFVPGEPGANLKVGLLERPKICSHKCERLEDTRRLPPVATPSDDVNAITRRDLEPRRDCSHLIDLGTNPWVGVLACGKPHGNSEHRRAANRSVFDTCPLRREDRSFSPKRVTVATPEGASDGASRSSRGQARLDSEPKPVVHLGHKYPRLERRP